MTVPVVLAIAGVISIFLSIWGGGIKAKEVEIPHASARARKFIGIIGLIFIGISIWLSTPSTTESQDTTLTVSPSLAPTLTISPTTITQSPIATNSAEAVVSRNKVNEWSLGETTMDNVVHCLNESDKVIARSTPFEKGDTIPSGVLLTTSFFAESGVEWNQFPLLPICINNGWGLFESVGEFKAITTGSYRRIVP